MKRWFGRFSLLMVMVLTTGCPLIDLFISPTTPPQLISASITIAEDQSQLAIIFSQKGFSSIINLEYHIVCSEDNSIDGNDPVVGSGSCTFPANSKGAIPSFSLSVPFTDLDLGSIAPGQYYIGLIVDPGKKILKGSASPSACSPTPYLHDPDPDDEAVPVDYTMMPDSGLRQAIADTAHVEPDDLVLDQLLLLESLDASDYGIADLTGVTLLAALSTLDLSNNLIANPALLGAMQTLASLDLSDNPITDLSGLSGLANLATLLIRNTLITDLQPLQAMYDAGSFRAITAVLDIRDNSLDIRPDSANRTVVEFLIDQGVTIDWMEGNTLADPPPPSGDIELDVAIDLDPAPELAWSDGAEILTVAVAVDIELQIIGWAAWDPGTLTIEWRLDGLPVLAASGQVSWTWPGSDAPGTHTVTVRISNGNWISSLERVVIVE